MKKVKLVSLSIAIVASTLVPAISTSCSSDKSKAIFNKDYFNQDANVFNPSLATFTGYVNNSSSPYVVNGDDYSQGDKNIKDFLSKYGFENFESNDDYKTEPTSYSMGCAIATMKLNNDTTLIAVGTRSLDYKREWISNITLDKDDTLSKGYHYGFYDAAQKIITFLKSYINKHSLTGNIKLWTAGYSRGAAAANIAGGLINQAIESKTIGDLIGNSNLTHNNFYCYNIATPQGVNTNVITDPRQEIYNNIFNIINPNDLITYLFPNNLKLDRFGIDKYICSAWTSQDLYEKYKSKAIDTYLNEFGESEYSIDQWMDSNLFKLLAGNIFKNYSMELTMKYGADLLGKIVGTTENYVNNYQEQMIQILHDSFAATETISLSSALLILKLFLEASDDDPRLTLIAKAVAADSNAIYNAHIITMYIGWLKTYDKNYNSDLNQFLDTYTYYEIETTHFNTLEIYDANKADVLASLKQSGSSTPKSTDSSNNIAIGAYCDTERSLTYVQAFMKTNDYQYLYGGNVTKSLNNANITLYEVTPKNRQVIKTITDTLTTDYQSKWL